MRLIGIGIVLSALVAEVAGDEGQKPLADRASRERTQRIIDGGSGEHSADRIVSSMAEASERLMFDFDAGVETQEIQGEVLDQLDEAIKLAEQRETQGRMQIPTSQPANQQAGKQRSGDRARRDAGRTPAGLGGQGRADRAGSGVGESPGVDRRGLMRELRHGWGHLPAQEREALMQGYDSESLPKYRQWIDEYFRALAEPTRREGVASGSDDPMEPVE